MNTKQHEIRRYLGLAWLAGALLYTMYAAYTYTGLFEWACNWQDRVFGAHDTTGAFLNALFLCALPGFVFEPNLRHLGKPTGPRPGAAALAAPDPVQQQRTIALLGGAFLLVGIVAGLMGFSANHGAQTVIEINLVQGEQHADVSKADQLIVTGMPQIDESAVLTTTLNGSETSETFIPLTGKNWDEGQPIQYVEREGAQVSSRVRPPEELGEDVVPRAHPQRDQPQPVRFGPAAIFRHALPGEVRSDWQKRGLILSPSLVVLDENLSRRSDTPLVICFMGILCGGGLLVLGVYGPRRTAAAAARRSAHSR